MNESNHPAVSVIVGVRNGAATLQRCIDSIVAQDFAARETIVFDGASTDATREIAERNLRGGRIDFVVSEPDRGVYDAWNKAVRRSRGRWISFLGCDDHFHDTGSLRALVEAGEAAGGRARIVYGRINRVTGNGVLVETIGVPWERARDAFLAGVNIPHPGTLHHREMLEEHGLFDTSYRIAADYHLLLGELRARAPLFVDRVVLDMGFGGMSSRPENILVSLREVARARREHGLRGTPLRLRMALAAATGGAVAYRLLGDRAYRRLADRYRALRGRPPIWTA
ncbi:MAG: glycosyltransferase [Betaproteobacteria bacterium]|nr:glycosyltransferase [Betaproteobacteria bacterium]